MTLETLVLKDHTQNVVEKLPNNQNSAYLWINSLNFYSFFLFHEAKLQTTWFYLI